MAVRPASTDRAASTSITSPPAALPRAYLSPAQPSTGLSSLTTRSSSTSRLYHHETRLAGGRSVTNNGWNGTGDGAGVGGVPAYQAWRRDSMEHPLLVRRRTSTETSSSGSGRDSKAGPRGRERQLSKGKGKAVAFVVGLPSSGEEGDVEQEEGAEEAMPTSRDGLEGVFSNVFDGRWEEREPSVEELIRAQIRQPIQTVDSLDLDSLLSNGVADYTFITDASLRSSPKSPSPPSQTRSDPSDKPVESPAPRPDRVVLGKGKFSEVLLVRKGETEYALKHTPLHPHHPLIATRLLRESSILAQLLPHRNLVKVFETIRTPGHFYLVEENLRSSVTLEALVSSSPGGVLPVEQVWSVLEQLASVVRSLHEPMKVCHRDIKPENVLVRVHPPPPSSPPNTPPTLLVKLLDFGLATHFSASEPKLTTCCGSPAYHSPELWRSLREQGGPPVRYWGPEIDIWCLGLTILRCLAPSKYPLGVSHTSLSSISDKVVDALLSIRDPHIRQVLAGFLNMDGGKRMRAFERFCRGLEVREEKGKVRKEGVIERDEAGVTVEAKPREFKSTSFLPSPVAHRLQLYLDEASQARSEGPKLEATVVQPGKEERAFITEATGAGSGRRRTARSTSTTRTAMPDSPKLSPTTVLATGLPRAASESPEIPQSEAGTASTEDESSVPPTPSLSPFPPTALGLYPSSSDSLASPCSLFSPSAESLSFHHPTYPPPIELTLLNPTDEPIRRAVSYVKYALRCSGVLYHVRDDKRSTSLISPSTAAFASPESAPPSLPPTPYIQAFPSLPGTSTDSFPFPSSSTTEDDDSRTCYLQCVVALPSSSSSSSASPSTASFALRHALQRPRLPPRAHTLGAFGPGHVRSASTPPQQQQAGRKDQQKKEFLQALSFFLSIRKASSPVPSSPYPSPSPFATFRSASGSATPTAAPPSPLSAPFLPRLTTSSRRVSSSSVPASVSARGARRRSRATSTASTSSSSPRTAYSSRIILTLSDDRALPFVRDALSLREGEAQTDSASAGEESSSSSATGGGGGGGSYRRGRTRFSGAVSPRYGEDNSGSRDARARREERAAKNERRREEEEERVAATSGRKGRSRSVDIRVSGGGAGGGGMQASGLRMEMGPVAEGEEADSGGGERGRRERTSSLWDFAAMLGRVVSGVGGSGGGGGESGSTTPTTEDGPERRARRRVKSTVEAAAGVL